jgi:transcriptional regulator with GAF, ATPase, and Fis domain
VTTQGAGSEPIGQLARQILLLAAEHEQTATFLEQSLPLLLAAGGADYVTLRRAERGKWLSLAAAGLKQEPPLRLLAEVLDGDVPQSDGAWAAAPLAPRSGTGEVLALHASTAAPGGRQTPIQELAGLLGAGRAAVRQRDRSRRRIERLEKILEISRGWNRTQRTDELLQQIAEASTQLLAAERASIFLWDKANRTLVGRPALGIEDDELRLPDDAGVVGQVIHTGEPRRVDRDEARREVDRRVDRQLGFETRNLLCVPLQTPRGELFGAFEMLNKIGGDFTDDDQAALSELAGHAAIALENSQQVEKLLRVQRHLTDQAAQRVRMIGECPAIESLRTTVSRIADTDLALLILGENGTGKEVVAQLIHYLSHRRDQPLVAVNCAALTETLLESELFGHEKGAFTDAHEARAGKFELASGGTLFLDEIGDMSPGGQAKLLRVLEEKVVVRVGGSRPIHTDARVIAATNQNLARMVRERRFREDLFFRLNVVTLDLPPLRERGEDVLLLAEHFLQEFCVKARRKPPKLTAAAGRRLLSHTWPGNIRELRNLMERLAYLLQGDKIEAEDLSFILAPDPTSTAIFALDQTLNAATRRFQTEYVTRQIAAAGGNMSATAERLGLHRSNLYRKMRQLGMNPDEEEA